MRFAVLFSWFDNEAKSSVKFNSGNLEALKTSFEVAKEEACVRKTDMFS
jgi:hypothetical protein